MRWHYLHKDVDQGPITTAELEDLAKSGVVECNTLIWNEDDTQRRTWGELRTPAGAEHPEKSWGVWRHGKRLIVRAGLTPPAGCWKCNGDHGLVIIPWRVAWHPPAYYLLLAIWPIYARVASEVTVEGRIAVGLCRRHRLQRTGIKAGVFLLGLVCIGLFAWSYLHSWEGVLWWLLLGIIAIIYSFAGVQVIRAIRFTKTHVWLVGVGAEYLRQFPEWPGE